MRSATYKNKICGVYIRKGEYIRTYSDDNDIWEMRYDGVNDYNNIISLVGSLCVGDPYRNNYNASGVIDIEDIIQVEKLNEEEIESFLNTPTYNL